jgi:hypothetical protein
VVSLFRSRSSARAAAVLLVLALAAGCRGSDDEGVTPLAEDTPSSSPSVSDDSSAPSDPSRSTPSEETRPFDAKGNDAIRGTVEAESPEEQEVADAWFAYWDARTRSFFRARVDPQLGQVAAADAAADVVRYVKYLKDNKLNTVGDTRFGVREIEVNGDRATLESCAENKSLDRRTDGSAAEQLQPFFTATGRLTRRAGSWRVVSVTIKDSQGCEA